MLNRYNYNYDFIVSHAPSAFTSRLVSRIQSRVQSRQVSRMVSRRGSFENLTKDTGEKQNLLRPNKIDFKLSKQLSNISDCESVKR